MRLIPKYQSPTGPIVENDNNEHATVKHYSGEDLYNIGKGYDPSKYALHIHDRNQLLLEKGIPIAAIAGLGGFGYGVYKFVNWFMKEHDKQLEEGEKRRKHKLGGRLYPKLINNGIKNIKINEVS